MKVIIEKDISDYEMTPEELAEMSDDDIIEMCMRDLDEFFHKIEWQVIREEDEINQG